jgi:hypothetical protein
MFYTRCQWWILRNWLQRSVLHCTSGLSWHCPSCQHFVRYEGAMTAIGIEIVGLMMLIRWNLLFPSQKASTADKVYRVIAMYRDQRAFIALAVFLLLVWVAVTAWLLSSGGRMVSPSPRHIWIYDKASSRYSCKQHSLWDAHFFAHDNLIYVFTACTMVFNSCVLIYDWYAD